MSPDDRREKRNGSVQPRFVDARWALTGGAFTAIFVLGLMGLVGGVADYEARRLLEATMPTIRFLSSSVMTASATILALMLTMLGMSAETEAELKGVHYRRIQQTSVMAVVALIASIAVLMILTFPLEESEQLRQFYSVVYYTLLGASAVLGGMMVSVVLMLLNAIRELVGVFHPRGDSQLLADERK
ncbi:MAG: hypothetical protein GWM90_20260 [Gemmatimonadetes bacterium]|nr:hypothetical protein [Gemmatimonadota bacterium]NIQ56797.1 hypothetical protein [Gemmatimonadota bacterium]NIU76979.1 hypothetical protein [Gammaproteobacteria bacterium]NIX46332.1 hypothetical protein [Gemmatimonadota bacterium]NIY10656.1 hypothetical protein [Gemmatimonadota bacterium]